MLTEDRLTALEGDCTACARDNWDGSVTVEQDKNGCLLFTLFDDDGDESARMEARPHGETTLGAELWKFVLEGEEEADDAPVGTLVPKMICGLLGL